MSPFKRKKLPYLNEEPISTFDFFFLDTNPFTQSFTKSITLWTLLGKKVCLGLSLWIPSDIQFQTNLFLPYFLFFDNNNNLLFSQKLIGLLITFLFVVCCHDVLLFFLLSMLWQCLEEKRLLLPNGLYTQRELKNESIETTKTQISS